MATTNLPATIYKPAHGFREAITTTQHFITDTAGNFLVDTLGNFIVDTTTELQRLSPTAYTANDGV